jgi:hypothetical protein
MELNAINDRKNYGPKKQITERRLKSKQSETSSGMSSVSTN